jgi:hypothetical protein
MQLMARQAGGRRGNGTGASCLKMGIGNLISGRSIPMTDQAISPLRRRMIEDMTIRKFAPKTQQGYIRTIKNLAAFIGRSPDTANFEDVRRFQLHVVGSGVGIGALNQTVAALRFFFRVMLGLFRMNAGGPTTLRELLAAVIAPNTRRAAHAETNAVPPQLPYQAVARNRGHLPTADGTNAARRGWVIALHFPNLFLG